MSKAILEDTLTIEYTIFKIINKLPFPDAYCKMQRNSTREGESYMVECGSNFPPCEIKFKIDPSNKKLDFLLLDIGEKYRGQGWGRKSVEVVENIARKLGYSEINIVDNENPSFWQHMGYHRNKKTLK